MIVVHGLWRDDRLSLWAEDSALAVTPARASRTTPAHPFAVAADQLAGILDGAATKAPHGVAELHLPTRAGVVLDSPELVRDNLPDHGRGVVSLRRWRVPALEFDPDDALVILCELEPDKATIGATVRHLAQLASFAHDLVVRGRMLPSLDRRDQHARAVWRPVLTGADASWAQALTLALPPAGRAGAMDAARDVVGPAMDALVDAAARIALAAAQPSARRRLTSADELGPAWRAWLDALTGSERGFAATDRAVAELDEALSAWQRDAAAGQVRACFRLVEPTGPDLFASDRDGDPDEWRLEFALQAADDPSMLIDADLVWNARGALSALSRQLDSPQETLLTELGRASRLYPDLDDALGEAHPAALRMDGNGAHKFLREGAPMLAGAGFGVMLPGWWSKPKARLGARLTSSAPSAPGVVQKDGGVGLDAIVDYQWQVAIGDQPLTEEELAPVGGAVPHWSGCAANGSNWTRSGSPSGCGCSTRGEMTVADLIRAGTGRARRAGGCRCWR